jgi:DNA recombination protein RmuC
MFSNFSIAMELILISATLLITLGILFLVATRKSDSILPGFSTEFEKAQEKIIHAFREDISMNRRETQATNKELREELGQNMKNVSDSLLQRLDELSKSNDIRMEKVRETVDKRLEDIQKDSSEKLEKMRETVDEKLHATLEKRLGESFKLVSERLDLVHKGLGEMQTLATGVGDLKKVLQNVKTRGTWGEVQLGNLLDEMMTTEQYEKNVATKKDSNDRVEFAIKIPAKDEKIKHIWLPIDAKFPLEDFQSLIDAEEKNDPILIDKLSKALENRIKSEAKDIRDKYLDPPYTTDFGILFLPIESLYAEVLRRPGLSDTLQREYKVIITGPTTIAAILNSLQMGFRTLAIEKRSSEVWAVLGAIKKEFTTFGDLLDKTHKKLQEASNTIDDASKKSRTIERKLNKVQELPASEVVATLPLPIPTEEE